MAEGKKETKKSIRDTEVTAATAISLLKVTPRCVMYITKNFGSDTNPLKKWEAIFSKHSITYTKFEE